MNSPHADVSKNILGNIIIDVVVVVIYRKKKVFNSKVKKKKTFPGDELVHSWTLWT